MNLLITGGLGHIGSYLLRNIQSKTRIERIIVIDSLQTQRLSSLFNLPSSPEIKFIEKNIGKLTTKEVSSFGSIDCIIHLAATTDASGSIDKHTELFQNNLGATNSVIELSSVLDIPMIFPSSTSVYGSQSALVDELCDELLPQSPYAECKLVEEQAVLAACALGMQGVVLRFGTIHGISPGMRFHTAVNRFCFQAANHLPLSVWKTALHQKRPYLSLDDASRAISHAIDEQLFVGEIYNVVTANHTVSQIIDAIELEIGQECIVEFVESQIMNQLSYEVSSEKFQDTGFIFKGSLQNDIRDTMRLLSGIMHD